MAYTKTVNFGRKSWSDKWFPVNIPDVLKQPNTLYITQGLPYVIPFFPNEARFVGSLYFLQDKSKLADVAAKVINDHGGPIRLLTSEQLYLDYFKYLELFGLAMNFDDCVEFLAGWGYPFQSCSLYRITDKQQDKRPLELPLIIPFNRHYLPMAKGTSGLERHSGNNPGVWSIDKEVNIYLAKKLPKQFRFKIHAKAFGPNVGNPFIVKVGDQEKPLLLGEEASERELIFDIHNREDGMDTIKIIVPSPASPAKVGRRSDQRKLGIFIFEIKLEKI